MVAEIAQLEAEEEERKCKEAEEEQMRMEEQKRKDIEETRKRLAEHEWERLIKARADNASESCSPPVRRIRRSHARYLGWALLNFQDYFQSTEKLVRCDRRSSEAVKVLSEVARCLPRLAKAVRRSIYVVRNNANLSGLENKRSAKLAAV
ncbi:uncharacterized protein EDB93DRAFT_1102423 [Suillus bovinus]|uniref:uncharacterized protein n=1 Tax=Suillus bovinus TaxID=48563 RepID=UPI001B882C9F|nr:uncharacterized protein EDB93DRAFT_1102423 [Suillus bovinus]KAG2154293.1 hypothetical protein EDB93DRAFT_1102423 [Suillus bovinus]